MSTSRRPASRKRIAPSALNRINRFVVLMLENRSFDHMLGYMKASNPEVAGMDSTAFNYDDPRTQSRPIQVKRATATTLRFDPAHEFDEVQTQLYGPAKKGPNAPSDPAAMSGFVFSSREVGGTDAQQVMECFEPDQLPVFSALAEEFAIFNFWYSPMPGPTWPNRFFVHASTSGGLSESPGKFAMVRGFRFSKGTLYDQLSAKRKSWRIYHEDLPQAIGIKSMLRKYLQKDAYFRLMDKFYRDVKAGDLPDYTFIEPRYDAFNDFAGGNSMHPKNDVGEGERLIKRVYEAIRNSRLWADTMLVITFDEHGGFYDHVPPPQALPTGDDSRYASKPKAFPFNRYGIRVPTIVVSPYTERRTIIGRDPREPGMIFDHASIVATIQKRLGLRSLSKRDANANTLDVAVNRAVPRDRDAPKKLPAPLAKKRPPVAAKRLRRIAPRTKVLTKDQEAFLGLAIALDSEMHPARRKGIMAAAATKVTPRQAGAYAAEVQAKALARRGETERSKVTGVLSR